MPAQSFDAKQFVSDFERGFNSKDLTKALSYYDRDVETTGEAGKVQRGIEPFRQAMEGWMNGFSDTKIDVKDVIQQGNSVAIVQRCTALHTGDFEVAPGERVPATNKRVEIDVAEFIRLNEQGKIVRDLGFMDTAQLMRQLGVLPSASQRTTSQRAVQR